MRSRTLILVPLLSAFASPGTTEPRTFDLLTASVEDIQAAVDAGALTYERSSRKRVAPNSTPHLSGEVFTYE